MKTTGKIKKERLEYLRGELQAERISQGELLELQSLKDYIEEGDVELLEAAGVPEFEDETTEKLFDQEIFNIILVHVARTWERIRITQPFEEMKQDNIMSSECAIPEIASQIIDDKIIQEFIMTNNGEVWLKTKQGVSDCYIESLAEKLITENYL